MASNQNQNFGHEKMPIASDSLKRKLRIKYAAFHPLPSLSHVEKRAIASQLVGIDFRKGAVICCPHDIKNLVFLCAISWIEMIKIQAEVQIICENTYKLVDLQLTDYEREHPLRTFDRGILALWLGYGEMEHGWHLPLIEHRMQIASTKGPLHIVDIEGLSCYSGQSFLLFYKGTKPNLQVKFPSLVRVANELKFPIVEIKTDKLRASTSNDECEEI